MDEVLSFTKELVMNRITCTYLEQQKQQLRYYQQEVINVAWSNQRREDKSLADAKDSFKDVT